MSNEQYDDNVSWYSPMSDFSEPPESTIPKWPKRSPAPPVEQSMGPHLKQDEQKIIPTAAVHPLEYFAQKYKVPRVEHYGRKAAPTVQQFPWLANHVSVAQARADFYAPRENEWAIRSTPIYSQEELDQNTRSLGKGPNLSATNFYHHLHGFEPFTPEQHFSREFDVFSRPHSTRFHSYKPFHDAKSVAGRIATPLEKDWKDNTAIKNTKRRPLFMNTLKRLSGRKNLKLHKKWTPSSKKNPST